MRRMLRMLRVFWVFRVFRVLGMRRMLREIPILGWPLLAAPGEPGRAAKRVLLDLHGPMVGGCASSAGAVAGVAHHIGIAKLRS